jgi:hypothetical protein
MNLETDLVMREGMFSLTTKGMVRDFLAQRKETPSLIWLRKIPSVHKFYLCTNFV